MTEPSPDSGRMRRVTVLAVGAFVLYGGWAVFANWEHGTEAALLAGVTQGALSLASTIVLTTAMEWVFARLSAGVHRFLATGLGPMTVSLLIMALGHVLAGTPEILATMLPSITVGYAFTLLYAATLTRTDRLRGSL